MNTVTQEHSQMVKVLAKKGEIIKDELTPSDAHLLHMAIGVCGEAGELIDAIKKKVIYQKPLDFENVIEELGDIEFYMEGIREHLQYTRDYVLAKNIEKLSKRYPNWNYTNQAAQTRADKTIYEANQGED